MSDSMKIGHMFPISSSPLQVDKSYQKAQVEMKWQGAEFHELLQSKVLKFSHHAEVRMEQRGIQIKPESLSRIMKAVDEAASKGARDSLIVYKDIAMIVNVPSRTVVTAMDESGMRSNVFTQIDSAIILK